VPGQLYQLNGPAAGAGYAVQLVAILLTARSSARLDVLDLAGVRPFLAARTGAPPEHVPLVTTGLYGFVRHPLYFAWMLLVFAAPQMTMTRLTFAMLSTAYLAIAIPFEERALVRGFGPRYREYQRRVRWRMLPGVY
jgi:protein-S-isoprenylcysteine O-methyltransferase Ste14